MYFPIAKLIHNCYTDWQLLLFAIVVRPQQTCTAIGASWALVNLSRWIRSVYAVVGLG